MFDGVSSGGKRKIYFVHVILPSTFSTGELSKVTPDGGYTYDREALGLGFDFHSPAGRGPFAWLSESGIWIGEIDLPFYNHGWGYSGCY